MSSDEVSPDAAKPESQETHPHPPTEPAAMATANKKRPRLDLNVDGGRERKRGKSMFGILLGTLNKAKIEDKERGASEAAKKRQMIEQRLQTKLRKETDSVRRAEEVKKDKTTANRKEEDLQLKDSIYKLRRRRLPVLSSFLLTSDVIPPTDDSPPPSTNPLAPPPRTHPPPLYYLPAILTPTQEAFISRRKAEVREAAEKEWAAFREERAAGMVEIRQFRQRVAEEVERERAEQKAKEDMDVEAAPTNTENNSEDKKQASQLDNSDVSPANQNGESSSREAGMEVEDGQPAREESKEAADQEKKDESGPMQGDDEDAVEY